MELEVKTLDGASAGSITVSDEIFGLEPRADILQRIVRWQLAKRQAGTHKAKIRSEVNRTGRKMYKQKGTGRARHGDQSAPQFRGGGKAFGPLPRSHAHDLPKKVRALGLKHALSAKAKASTLIVVDEATAAEPKTKALRERLAELSVCSGC
jgi:large subunit ribosomal protein L4